jgi:hypothetical protein
MLDIKANALNDFVETDSHWRVLGGTFSWAEHLAPLPGCEETSCTNSPAAGRQSW